MKKVLALICTLAVLTALSVSALADVIWTPEDDFLKTHMDECTVDGRRYYANARDGAVAVLTQPGGKTLATAKNGAVLYVQFTYNQDGAAWGLVEYDTAEAPENWLGWESGKESGTGWVQMERLLVIYDSVSFQEEYSAAFTAYDGSFDTLLHSTDQRVLLWTYPLSGEVSADFEHLDQDYGPLELTTTWTDGEGRVWGQVNYYEGDRGWVCLSDPANEHLPVTEHAYDLYPAAGTTTTTGNQSAGTSAAGSQSAIPSSAASSVPVDDVPKTGDETVPAVVIGVAAVCAVTVLLLVMVFRHRGQEES